jgi:hypothetical protein
VGSGGAVRSPLVPFPGPAARRNGLGAAGAKHRPYTQLRQDSVFGFVHDAESGCCSIVVPTKVQHPVQGVQQQLPFHWNPPLRRLPPGFGDANNHLARYGMAAGVFVQRERQNVGGPGDRHEPFVEL